LTLQAPLQPGIPRAPAGAVVAEVNGFLKGPCLWRERHPWGIGYEATPDGLARAHADMDHSTATGEVELTIVLYQTILMV
jgi:hypothetical protein